jgi:molecular chaperone DnaJ
MANTNHYETLQVSQTATQAEIKQAYRRLVKLFHPDSNSEIAGHDPIVRLNAAYEVLSDPHRRQSYDKELHKRPQVAPGGQRTAAAQQQHRSAWQAGHDADEHLEQWMQQVYKPVNQILCQILYSLEEQLDELSADPFDDDLIAAFQAYLKECRDSLRLAQMRFRSMPNPRNVAGCAVHLYHCINQVGDGLDELEFFPLNYDDRYLHTGQELFRIATGLRCEAQAAIKEIKGKG